MELSSQEDHENIPIPLNTSYDHHHHHPHGHIIHHPHHHPTTTPSSPPNISQSLVNTHDQSENLHHQQQHPNHKKQSLLNVKYKECLKNHAASMGGNAIDGCGEFMPSGEEGSIEALTCSACGCHRNFHRREVEGDKGSFLYNSSNGATAKKLMLTHHHHKGLIRSAVPSQMIMPSYGYSYMGGGGGGSHHPYILPNSESDDQMDLDEVSAARPVNSQAPAGTQLIGINQHHHHRGGGGGQTTGMMMMAAAAGNNKKRFRTKFTPEQKERMLEFAERVGWKIQRQEESVVQQFCQDLGIKRRVLKVWMHNNKHNLAKKNIENNNNNNNNISNSVSNAGNNTANLASSA